MALRHVLLKNPRLKGREYGVLRAFEDDIVRETGADVIEVPDYGYKQVVKRIGHNMRWDPARHLMPKKSFPVDADVIWYILMGAENYELDLFKDWDVKARYRIAYLYDTLQPQFPVTKKLFSDDRFNIRITSFHDAVPYLEKLTGKKWHAVEQAVPSLLFGQVPVEEKLISFSSYGRKFPVFHEALLEFCKSNKLYYDFSTDEGKHPIASENELYNQYAWHLNHSFFNISWPVEITSPYRAGKLNPVTCRWFEAASAGTIILGRKPGNKLFDQLLAPGLVVDIDPFEEKQAIWKNLDMIYSRRMELMENAVKLQKEHSDRWTWTNRTRRILGLLD
jgi:hypothetical protein